MSRRAKPKTPEGSTLERLVLAQSSWEVGTASWLKISRILAKHPLLAHRKTFFSAQSCHALYNLMMKDCGFELTEASHNPQEPIHLRLAEKYYSERVEELRGLIQAEEQQFMSITAEIDSLRSGKSDAVIEESVLPTDDIPAIEADKTPSSEATVAPETSPKPDPPTVDSTPIELDPPEALPTQEGIQAAEGELATQPTPQLETEESITEPAFEEAHNESPVDEQGHTSITAPEEPRLPEEPELEVEQSEGPDDVVPIEDVTMREESPPSIPQPPPPKKRGRKPLHKPTPEPDADATDSALETLAEDDIPLSAIGRKREGKRKASFMGGMDSPRERKRAREDSEPAEDEDPSASSTALRRNKPTGVAQKRFQTVITMVHSQISQHRNGNIFHNPIKTSEAPDYHDIVKRPIDLKTIKAKIKDGLISNSLEYQRDIYLMFANAMMYNRPGSDVHTMAEDMMIESDAHINAFRSVGSDHLTY
ncbi:Bromo domain-containing protein [Mycena indigotica]|uniref:Bromo domain-containing protein n=1 Tax=Mycena indigotica TaxID=2126181 RepID=A0A8H6W1M5_9AGAR|nr:Bromo domain-containing protein [Mycena indigotica]KAF7301712.1 Bromo domain-containing protein [Mycena indigotica]